jgi:hypothetical protein
MHLNAQAAGRVPDGPAFREARGRENRRHPAATRIFLAANKLEILTFFDCRDPARHIPMQKRKNPPGLRNNYAKGAF